MSEATPSESSEHMMPTPGEPHRRLQPFAGQFHSTVKIWMGPGEPMVSTGRMTNTWVLGGLYLAQEYVGNPQEGPFPSFAGQGFWGFNTVTQQYEGFWIDNASTMMQIETGNVDAAGRVWEMHSTIQATPQGPPQHRRSRITLHDHDRHAIEMFFISPEGRDIKGMEIQYVRVK